MLYMMFAICLQYPEPRFVSIPDVDKIFRSSTYLMRESCDLRDDYHFFLLKFKVIQYMPKHCALCCVVIQHSNISS